MEKQDKNESKKLSEELERVKYRQALAVKLIGDVMEYARGLEIWLHALYGWLMVIVGMVFYQSFRLAVIEHNIWTARYYAIVTAGVVCYGSIQLYRVGKDLREAEEENLSFKKLFDEDEWNTKPNL